MTSELGLQRGGPTDEHEAKIEMARRCKGAVNDDVRAVVAAHRVNSNLHRLPT
jgi:hypothetical protein